MKKGNKMKPETKKCMITGLVVFCLVSLLGGALFYLTVTKLKKEFNQVNVEMETRLSGATRTCYRTLTEIKKGQIITEDLVELVTGALSDDSQEYFMTVDDIGKEATIDIPQFQFVTRNMVAPSLSENWQETELDCIWLSSNLEQYDYVDLRILFPNGVDYVVAAKKCIRKVDLSINNAYFWLNEDELLALNAAIVDANRHGAKIYTTRYVNPAVQEAHKVNYQPTDDIIDLMKVDPNIVKESARALSKGARAAMEEKLQAFKDSVVDQENAEELEGYDFRLDTTTNAGTGGESPNNNGTEVKEEEIVTDEYQYEESPSLDTSRNEDVSNQTTLEEDAALTQ